METLEDFVFGWQVELGDAIIVDGDEVTIRDFLVQDIDVVKATALSETTGDLEQVDLLADERYYLWGA